MAPLEQLRIRLLGGLEVEGLAQAEVGSRKARTLLKLLALARGAPVSVDRIADALWGHAMPSRPAEQVSVLVSRLRNVVGTERITRDDAGWTLKADWIDIVELTERVDLAAARLHAGGATAARAAARAATELLRGELLADEPDATWAEAARTTIAATVARARALVAEAALAAGDPGEAAAAAEAALSTDPYDESALRVLMRAHVSAGRPASALAAYARVRGRLSEDLGVDPSPETEELHTAILVGDAGLAASVPMARSPGLAIVGRAAELSRLDELLADAQRGSAVLAIVEGEAGIGKTTLVNTWVATVDALVLTGRCDELGRDLPLQPLIDAVDRQLRIIGDDAAQLALGDQARVIGPLVGRMIGPESAEPTTTTVGDTSAQGVLFAALLTLIDRFAAGGPVVLVIEDLHLASASTVEWLRFASRRASRLLAIATQRAGEGRDLPDATVVRLGPLDLDDVASLVGGEHAAALFDRTRGHPLFVVELAATTGDDIPTTLREAVVGRLESLGDAAATLRAAAVLGQELDVDLLGGVLDQSIPVLLEHLEAGVRARIIEERGASLAFRHELVREALADDTTATRRAWIHRQAAGTLATRPRHDPLEVAWHARLGGDVERASVALEEAAAIAEARADLAAAEDHLTTAIELADRPSARVARGRVRVGRWRHTEALADATAGLGLGAGADALEVAGWAAYYLRDLPAAQRYAEEALARDMETPLRVSCLTVAARMRHSLLGDLTGADALFEEAAAERTPTRRLAQIWLGTLRMHQGRPAEGVELVDCALVDPSYLGHPFALGHALTTRAMSLGAAGQAGDALAAAAEAQVRLDGAQQRFLAITMNVEGWVLRNLGEVEAGDERNTAAVELMSTAEEEGPGAEPRFAGLLDLIDGRLQAGDLAGAEALIVRTAPIDHWLGAMSWHQQERFRVLRARFHLATGEPDRALELVVPLVEANTARGAGRYEVFSRLVAAQAQFARGDKVNPADIEPVLARLDTCAGLEAWWYTAALAAACGIDQWWTDADRRAETLLGFAGEHADSLRTFIARRMDALGH